jgi:hypothetical protein
MSVFECPNSEMHRNEFPNLHCMSNCMCIYKLCVCVCVLVVVMPVGLSTHVKCPPDSKEPISLLYQTQCMGSLKSLTLTSDSCVCLTVEARVQFQASSCGICGRPSVTGSGFWPSTSVVPWQYPASA